MNLHVKSPGSAPGVYPIVQRGKQMKYLSFTIVQLGDGLKEHDFSTGDEEVSLDFYSGPVRVEVESSHGGWSADVPARDSIRQPHPMVYIPAGANVRITSLNGEARVTAGGAAGKPDATPALINGEEIVSRTVGKDSYTRTVFTHIADNINAAHLICGETLNTPGCWSSCPPHKHDRFNEPFEVPMEEIYYFQVDPVQGFGFMRVYTN